MLGGSTPEEAGEAEGSASSVPPADSEDDGSATRKRGRGSEELEDSSSSPSSDSASPLDVPPLRSVPPKATLAKKRCLNPHWAGALPTVISSGE